MKTIIRNTIILSALSAAFIIGSSSCFRIAKDNFRAGFTAGMEDYGQQVTTPVEVTDSFFSIDTYTTTDIEYVNGPVSVTLTAPEKIIGKIEVKVENGTLKVGIPDKEDNRNLGMIKSTLVVSAPGVNKFISTGTGDIDIKGAESKEIVLNTTGTGDIDVSRANCVKFTANTSGTGDIEAEYVNCTIAELNTSGTGDIEIKRISAEKISGMSSGTGDIEVKGECDQVNISKSGIGSVNTRGLEIRTTEE
ncbi:MAG: DUF2807 domain-containing protein [Muribaculaceae bacterium]|nr:DUF2807 domain-containing protein [Muribaculaceae bacterium]